MERVEELNKRIYARNQGDIPAFYFSPRPVPTKYTTLPILDERKTAPPKCKSIFNVSTQFLPSTYSPWSGKASTIDIETDLYRPKMFVPSSNSDLYKFSFKADKQGGQQYQPFPELFTEEKFNSFNPNPENVGEGLFNNCTRQQIKDLTGKSANGCKY